MVIILISICKLLEYTGPVLFASFNYRVRGDDRSGARFWLISFKIFWSSQKLCGDNQTGQLKTRIMQISSQWVLASFRHSMFRYDSRNCSSTTCVPRKTSSRHSKPPTRGISCLSRVLYGMRVLVEQQFEPLDQWEQDIVGSRPMRVERTDGGQVWPASDADNDMPTWLEFSFSNWKFNLNSEHEASCGRPGYFYSE